MKLITLNAWGGRGGRENILKFFEEHKDTDIFCLQEILNGGQHVAGEVAGGTVLKNIMHDLLQEITAILKDHDVRFCPLFDDWYGLAVFIKKDIKVIEEGEVYVYKEKGWVDEKDKGNHARNIQWLSTETKNGPLMIINFHGLWNGKGKGDVEDRLKQSDNIINFIKNISTPHILAGDFNLLPDTESLKKLESFGLRNLVREYGVTSTRTSLYTKPEKFADYIFTSNEIKVKDFKVLPEEVSDHAALYVEFE